MMNPAQALKMMGMVKTFTKNHPKVSAFLKLQYESGFPEGTVIEISVQRPGAGPQVTNMRVTAEDLALLEELGRAQKS